LTKKKNLQIQLGFSVKNVSVDIIVDNEGFHIYVDKFGDLKEY